VDTEYFEPAAAPAVGPVTLLAVGRLVKQKRLDRFIELVGRLRNEFKLEVRGVIAGSGRPSEDLQSRLERQARSLGMSPEVLCFRGSLSDVRPVYQEASACILTSDHEGTPNVLLEAMASGLPVVATRVGGVPEIVRHGQTGFLREPDDLEGLVADAFDLVTNARLRSEMGRRARAFVEEHHNLQRLPAYLSGLYRLAQGTRRGRRAPFTPAHSPSDRETASCVGRT
jgi:glycosyltransferase involved in cell wall biosynthesis